jgi:hypothetical protein
MRKRLVPLLALCSAALLLLAHKLSPLSPFDGASWSLGPISPLGYYRIRLGVTRAQVKEVIGLPPGNHQTRPTLGGITAAGNHGRIVLEAGIPSRDLPDGRDRPTQVTLRQWWGDDWPNADLTVPTTKGAGTAAAAPPARATARPPPETDKP